MRNQLYRVLDELEKNAHRLSDALSGNSAPKDPEKDIWEHIVFSGRPPDGYRSWGEFAASRYKTGAYVRAATPEDWRGIEIDPEAMPCYQPAEKPEPWNGEGTPPVGAWVRLAGSKDTVEVMCHGKRFKFCGRDTDGYIGIFSSDEAEPLKSERDRFIELGRNTWMTLPNPDCADIEDVLGRLHDAGFRPPEVDDAP